jgi:hypothetical protein
VKGEGAKEKNAWSTFGSILQLNDVFKMTLTSKLFFLSSPTLSPFPVNTPHFLSKSCTMQFTIFFLFLAMTMAAFALENGPILDYSKVATCARSCSFLTIAMDVCVPPIALLANRTVYLDCFCQSSYLKTLHDGGNFYHEACTETDALTIHSYYRSLCDSATSPQALPSSSNTTPLSSAANEPTLPPSPPSDIRSKAEEPETWLHSHWKTLLVVVLASAFAFAVLLCLVWLYWRRRNANAKKANRGGGLISLQLLPTSRSTRTANSPSQPRTPGSEENFPATVPASPLAPPHSSYSFGETLRFYAEKERERQEAIARTKALGDLIRSHSKPNLALAEV